MHTSPCLTSVCPHKVAMALLHLLRAPHASAAPIDASPELWQRWGGPLAGKVERHGSGAASVAPCNLLFWLELPYATSVLVTKY